MDTLEAFWSDKSEVFSAVVDGERHSSASSSEVGAALPPIASSGHEQQQHAHVLPCGAPYYVETHLSPGQPGHYVNCVVFCNKSSHNCQEEHPCMRSRTFSSSHTEHFGHGEVLGFSGHWLARSHECDSRSAHMAKRRSSVVDIRSYLETHHAMPQFGQS